MEIGSVVLYFLEGWRYGTIVKISKKCIEIEPIYNSKWQKKPHHVKVQPDDIKIEKYK